MSVNHSERFVFRSGHLADRSFFDCNSTGNAIGGPVVILSFVTGLQILGAVLTFLLLKPSGNKLAAQLAVVALLPIVGLTILIPANVAAARKLRASGLKVGPLGVPKTDRDALRTALARESGR